MKKKIIAIILLLGSLGLNLYGQLAVTGAVSVTSGLITTDALSETFDPNGYLQAVEDVFYGIEQVMQNIVQIENMYTQIQQTISNAQGLDWDSIKDGNPMKMLKKTGIQINGKIDHVRKCANLLTNPTISSGYGSYSIADLCGLNGDDKNLEAAMKDMNNYMTDNMDAIATRFENGLTSEQAKAILLKTGLSPKNYFFLQQSSSKIKEKAMNILGLAENAAKEGGEREEDENAKFSKSVDEVVEKALNLSSGAGGENDGMSQAAANEANIMELKDIRNQISALTDTFEQYAGYETLRACLNKEKEEIEQVEKMNSENQRKTSSSRVPNSFRK